MSDRFPITKDVEVCIIGNGFAGLNTARILTEQGISCEIYGHGYGASQLWMGTVDVLNYPGDDFFAELAKFQASFSAHPYARLTSQDFQLALDDFFITFPQFQKFEEEGQLTNQHVLTMLGTTKLCMGVWNTVFRDFGKFTSDSVCVLINFEEFNNTAMWLIAKGLKEKFKGRYYVLNISLSTFFQQTDSEMLEKLSQNNMSLLQLAIFFDQKAIHFAPMASLIKNELKIQYPQVNADKISLYLFPPLLGIEYTQTILSQLMNFLGADCYETLALSPSIMAPRFMRKFERKIDSLGIVNQKGWMLTQLHREDRYWVCTFTNQKNETIHVRTSYAVIATGSVFVKGVLVDSITRGNLCHRLGLEYPESIGPNFEALAKEKNPGLFFVGAATYLFSSGVGDEDEIRDGTGLGLAITSSYKVAYTILSYHQKTSI